jgi:GDP-D-mannose dehydratase
LGNPQKARQVLDWQPSISFEQMVRVMVDCDLRTVMQNRSRPGETAD